MANLLKFYRGGLDVVTSAPVGAIWFDTDNNVIKVRTATGTEADWEAYGKSATELETILGDYVLKTTTIAGIDLGDSITVEELQAALGLTAKNLAGEANVLEGVKVNGAELTIGADKKVDVLIAEGTTDGTIAVNGKDVAVHGLGGAAYKAEDYYVKAEGFNEYTAAEEEKLAGIETGAEVNIIEEVRVNGTALEVSTDGKRAVDIVIPDATVKGVKKDDKVLALGEDGMLSTKVSLSYKSTSEGGDGYIYLTGIDNVELGKIDAAEFVKDGMIDSVVMGENNVLTITWNTASGKTEATTIDFSKYIDTFTHYGAANGVKIENEKYVGVVDSASETFLTVGADGFKLSGVQTAIDTAKADAIAAIAPAIQALDADVTSTGGAKVTVEVTEVDGKITAVNVAESDIASAKDLSDLTIVVNENEQVTSAALNELNGRMVTAEGEIATLKEEVNGINVGVTSITGENEIKDPTESDTWRKHDDFVSVDVNNTTGDVTLQAYVKVTKTTDSARALATDAYVHEQIAPVATVANSAVQSVTSASETLRVTRDANNVNVELAWAAF